MALIDGWNHVPFALELLVTGNDYMSVAGEVRERIAHQNPEIEIHPSTTISGWYGGALRGPGLHAYAPKNTFTKLTEGKLRRGIAWTAPFPQVYVKWYAEGDLLVPNYLTDVVQGIHIEHPVTGAFREFNLWAPDS